MASDLSQLDLLVIQIDGIHIEEDLMLLGAVGVDGAGGKHSLGVIEGATENATVAQALLDNLIERGLIPRSAAYSSSTEQALTKAIARPSDVIPDPALPSPQGPQHSGASAQAAACLCPQVLRQAWELDDATRPSG